MHGARKSDRPIVPAKPPNKAAEAAEVVEGRGLAKGNTAKRNTARTQRRETVLNELAVYVKSQRGQGCLLRPSLAVVRHSPEAGAQCVSSARWDLCGGRRVTLWANRRP